MVACEPSGIKASSSTIGVSFSGPSGSVLMTHEEFFALAREMISHGINKKFYEETP